MTMIQESEILTKPELAQYLKCDVNTIGNLVTTRQVPCFKLGKEYRFRFKEIAEWLSKKESMNVVRIIEESQD